MAIFMLPAQFAWISLRVISKSGPITEEPREIENQLRSLSVSVENEDSSDKIPICPFVNRTKHTWFDWAKIALGTIFIAPFRVIAMLLLITTGVSFSHVITTCRSLEQIQNEPMAQWRKAIKWVIGRCIMRAFYFSAGFQWVTVKGKQASPKEAPILVAAPHSSFYDSMLAVMTGCTSLVARSETLNETFNGQLMKMTQAVFVSRLDRDSRATAVQLITERAQRILNSAEGDWPQLLMFPEGTTDNRSCLVKFKTGAFRPGVPVQPVLISYPDKVDVTTWTFDGVTFSKVVWHSLTSIHNSCTIEFLPVYVPSEEEKQDADLYAQNVQNVMGLGLGIPISDYFFEDGIAIRQLPKERIVAKLNAVAGFREAMDVSGLTDVNLMRKLALHGQRAQIMASKENFLKELSLPFDEDEISKANNLFQCFDLQDGLIDKRQYLVYACLLNSRLTVSNIVQPIFLLYTQGFKQMTMENFTEFCTGNFSLAEDAAQQVFTTSPTITAEATIDLVEFTQKLKKRLTYIKLLALEAIGKLAEYPPRNREMNLDEEVYTNHHEKTS